MNFDQWIDELEQINEDQLEELTSTFNGLSLQTKIHFLQILLQKKKFHLPCSLNLRIKRIIPHFSSQ